MPLVGFSGESVIAEEGCLNFELPVILEEGDSKVRKVIKFVVPSTFRQMLKYQTKNRVGSVRSEQKASRECYATTLKGTTTLACLMIIGEASMSTQLPTPISPLSSQECI